MRYSFVFLEIQEMHEILRRRRRRRISHFLGFRSKFLAARKGETGFGNQFYLGLSQVEIARVCQGLSLCEEWLISREVYSTEHVVSSKPKNLKF